MMLASIRVLILIGVLSWGGFLSWAMADTVPTAALKYRAELIRNARAVWGMNAPVATFAAQIHQESGWRPDALSQVGAQGLAQFMPATTTWMASLYPYSLGMAQPFNVGWSLRALVQYDRWLDERIRATSGCEQAAFVLSAYNGGLGWVNREKKLALTKGFDPLVWFDQVEQVNAGRSAGNWQENRAYPRRILLRHELTYIAAHWGRGACHD